ncbi:hypothetical protein BKA67DRAFT_656122 [Truncatella angustata]|uniref:CCHC-type domain-containing protein n=1 Tax=Truncatella angustata TaxID=152316 RepID=A0A9P8UT82_9PEZI|nr:uncharacterized protein BKA67DRAFT_656122 [Truncatella angustata]KAH6657881.1 hypothetical protein BKA67DRAFT_656122 [Truncatella angustata]
MAPLETRKTVDNERWEMLEVLPDILRRSIELHDNGTTPVMMTENSLYNIMTAGKDEFLEITVSKVIPLNPLASEVRTSLSIPHMSPTRTESGFGNHLTSKFSVLGQRSSSDWPSSGHTSRGERPRSRVTLDTRIFLPLPDATCGNCQRPGHAVRDCIGPVDEHGEIDGCPKCNTARAHLYDDCPARDPNEDFDYIYMYRQRKPPLKSYMQWQGFLSERYQPATWPKFIPWSSQFALAQQESAFRARRMPEWLYYEYDRIGWPDAEAHYREIDPESEYLVL